MQIIAEARLVEASENYLQFIVHEYLGMDDGRQLLMADDRGWTATSSSTVDLSLKHIVAGIDNVTLPDDAEVTGESRTWARYLRSLQQRYGIEMRLDELREADIVFRVSVDSQILAGLDGF